MISENKVKYYLDFLNKFKGLKTANLMVVDNRCQIDKQVQSKYAVDLSQRLMNFIYIPEIETYGDDIDKYHWTPQFVFDSAMPLISKALNLQFDKNNFKKVFQENENVETSYWVPNQVSDLNFTVIDYVNMSKKEGGLDVLRTNPVMPENPYRNMYAGHDRMSQIINKSINTGKRLALNTDSLSIPLAQHLAYFFDSILYIDNRTNRSYKWLIEYFKPTHWLSIGILGSWVGLNDMITPFYNKMYIKDKILNRNLK